MSDGTKIESYKCFLVGKYDGREVIIAPSFIEYFAGSDPRERDYEMGFAWKFNLEKFRVLVVGETDLEARDFGVLKDL